MRLVTIRDELASARGLPGFAPLGSMFHDPVGQGLFKADVAASFFRLQPFMPEDFVELRLKLFVEGGILNEIVPVGDVSRHMGVGVLSVTNM